MERKPYTPFEGLNEFTELKSLTHYIIKSVKVTQVKVLLPSDFDIKLIDDPKALVPVQEILIGNATFNYIRHRAAYVLNNVKERIQKIKKDSALSLADRFNYYKETRQEILDHYKYFEPMNLIHFMSAYQWKIAYNIFENEKFVEKLENYPSSKIDLKEDHWNLLEKTFIIRRDLLNEIVYLLDIEIDELRDAVADTRYIWKTQENYSFEIYELILALMNCGRIEIQKGTAETFIHDFLSFFGQSDKEFSYFRGKVLDRKDRSKFTKILEQSLDKYPRKK